MQTTPAHVLASSPAIREDPVECPEVQHIGTSTYEEHDHCTLDVASQELITVQFPVSATQLSHLSKGWTNVGATIYESIAFTLEQENCSVAWPYLDNG